MPVIAVGVGMVAAALGASAVTAAAIAVAITPIIVGAMVGAAIGAIGAAITGGDIANGAMMGGILGAVGGGISSAMAGNFSTAAGAAEAGGAAGDVAGGATATAEVAGPLPAATTAEEAAVMGEGALVQDPVYAAAPETAAAEAGTAAPAASGPNSGATVTEATKTAVSETAKPSTIMGIETKDLIKEGIKPIIETGGKMIAGSASEDMEKEKLRAQRENLSIQNQMNIDSKITTPSYGKETLSGGRIDWNSSMGDYRKPLPSLAPQSAAVAGPAQTAAPTSLLNLAQKVQAPVGATA